MPLKCFYDHPEGTRNKTCFVSRKSFCFSAVEVIFDPETQTSKLMRSFGCMSSYGAGLLQCSQSNSNLEADKKISCCRDSNLCNKFLLPELPVVNQSANTVDLPLEMKEIPLSLTIASSVAVSVFLLSLIVCLALKPTFLPFYKHWKKSSSSVLGRISTASLSKGDIDGSEEFSGSGCKISTLRQATIGSEIKLIRTIGQGRYGKVFLGEQKGEFVAVKEFSTVDGTSWENEKEIYDEIRLSHNKNILGFIAADIIGTASVAKMLLVTEYHNLGSLHDFLGLNLIDVACAFRMGFSVISGLSYLHVDMPASNQKRSIAHRDLKSKNILVKNRNGDCCIADFGLAVKCDGNGEMPAGINAKVGTCRYMAPEVLDGTINPNRIWFLKCADIYSYSLLLWEIWSRCKLFPENSCSEVGYHPPYSEFVPADPSIEDMADAVVINGRRPSIPPSWETDTITRAISRILRECWAESPNARLTALRIKKDHQKIGANSEIIHLSLP